MYALCSAAAVQLAALPLAGCSSHGVVPAAGLWLWHVARALSYRLCRVRLMGVQYHSDAAAIRVLHTLHQRKGPCPPLFIRSIQGWHDEPSVRALLAHRARLTLAPPAFVCVRCRRQLDAHRAGDGRVHAGRHLRPRHTPPQLKTKLNPLPVPLQGAARSRPAVHTSLLVFIS